MHLSAVLEAVQIDVYTVADWIKEPVPPTLQIVNSPWRWHTININLISISFWYGICFYLVRYMFISGTVYVSIWYGICLYLVRNMFLSGTVYVSIWYGICFCLVRNMFLSGTVNVSIWYGIYILFVFVCFYIFESLSLSHLIYRCFMDSLFLLTYHLFFILVNITAVPDDWFA